MHLNVAILPREPVAAVKRDVPDAEIHQLDAGHFIFDEQTDEAARLIVSFITRRGF